MKNRTATVKWQGGLNTGKGEISTESGALKKIPYTFNTRFGDEIGTNPEELIAAAHAACYSMALAVELRQINFIPDFIKVQAQVSFENIPKEGWKITNIHLDAEAVVLGCLPEIFDTAAEAAKLKCPVSELLKADITLDARLITLPGEVFEYGPVS